MDFLGLGASAPHVAHKHQYPGVKIGIHAVPPIPAGGIEAPAPASEPGPAVTGPEVVVVEPATVTVDSSGLGDAHENMPPYTALRYCMVAR